MCLVRLLNFLKLNKVTQISFAEYHSKRNLVEGYMPKRTVCFPNMAHLRASHSTIDQYQDLKNTLRIWRVYITEEVRKCIVQGSFGGYPLQCYLGIKHSDSVFTDEDNLQNFLSLNEEGKLEFSPSTYTVQNGHILDCLVTVWNLDEKFTGEYVNDHKALCNTLNHFTTSHGLTSTPPLSTPM